MPQLKLLKYRCDRGAVDPVAGVQLELRDFMDHACKNDYIQSYDFIAVTGMSHDASDFTGP